MTKAHESIYCIQCLSVKPQSKANLVFRTGFYRRTIPLGRCAQCADAELRASLFPEPQAEERDCGAAQLA